MTADDIQKDLQTRDININLTEPSALLKLEVLSEDREAFRIDTRNAP